MRKPIHFAAIATVVAIAVSVLVPLAARAGVGSRGGASNNGPYYVVKIVNPPEDTINGTRNNAAPSNVTPNPYVVLDAQGMKTKQTDLDKKYKDNVNMWEDEKKINPLVKRPLKPSIKKLKTFKTKEVADEYMQKLLDELAKKEGDKPKA